MTKTLFFNVLVSLGFAYWRVFVFPEGWRPDIVKTLAHLYIAGLLVYGWLESELLDLRYCWRQDREGYVRWSSLIPPKQPCWHFLLGVLLSIVEIIAFGKSRGFF